MTGEMTESMIEEGGEFHEWAENIKEDVKKIEEESNGKLKFKEMRPWDKYQGPYASVEIKGKNDKIWDVSPRGQWGQKVLYLEGRDWVGAPFELAGAIRGEEVAQRVVENQKKQLEEEF